MPAMNALPLTPMLQQYLEIKEQHRDCILFYRMGDFYEMFFDDAVLAAKILGITLTSRNKKTDPVQVPMCGIPYHAVQSYLAKLIKAGRRVAICEQVEDPATARGIVRREVVRIVSPGVITDDLLLDDKSNNYLCALTATERGGQHLYGCAFLDLSTGEFLVSEHLAGNGQTDTVLDQLNRLAPAEILVADIDRAPLAELLALFENSAATCITERASDCRQEDTATALLCGHFEVLSLDGFGCAGYSGGIAAAALLLEYAQETQKSSIAHIEKITPLETSTILHIDESSRRNLELTATLSGEQRQGSLLEVLDQTCTPMGARLFRHHLLFPLRARDGINSRLDAVSFFFKDGARRKALRAQLDQVYDLERLNSRMILGTGNGRDMLAMKHSLARLPAIDELLAAGDTERLIFLRRQLDHLSDLHQLLDLAINPEAPVSLREGHLIRAGYNQELDELQRLLRDGRQLILELEGREREAVAIPKLKIGYNRVFGYYIEISKAHSDKVPAHYIRKQTLVNAERFITPELKEFEEKVLGAEERRLELEYQLFVAIRDQLATNSSRILKTAGILAELDCLASNAETAHRYNYRRPEINDGDDIVIVEGRHPVIERSLPSGQFVPNDLHLGRESDQMLIITGPNMAGKSTVLRQTALIVLMAQMGCYVPAARAAIGLVDRIFTRVGAMDNLRRGQSTFMVEMSETANILNNATEKSLVILDEIGRGTSTYDGLSIAWAVAEDLAQKNDQGVKTLFATHYHELTELARNTPRIRNYSIAVREWQGKILFLHKLVPGGTSRSYGIQVAALAGVPPPVVARATEILKEIETGKFVATKEPLSGPRKTGRRRSHPGQLSLFSPPPDPLHEKIRRLNLDRCTPLEALHTLYDLKKDLEE
jgi:DNA mismatch repair protein MutS